MLSLRWTVRLTKSVGAIHAPRVARDTSQPRYFVSAATKKSIKELASKGAFKNVSACIRAGARGLRQSAVRLATWSEIPDKDTHNDLEYTTKDNMRKVYQGLMLLSLPTLFLTTLWFNSGFIVTPSMIALSGITSYMSWQLSKSFFSLNWIMMLSSMKLDWSKLREFTSFAPLSLLFGGFSMFIQVQFYLPFTLRFLVLAAQLGLYGYAMSQTNWRDRIQTLVLEPDWKNGLRQLAHDIYTRGEPLLAEYASNTKQAIARRPYGLELHQWGDGYAETASGRIPYSLMQQVLDFAKSRNPREIQTLGYDVQVNATAHQFIRRRAAHSHTAVRLSTSGYKKSDDTNFALVEGCFEIIGGGRRGVIHFVGDVENLTEVSTSLQDKQLDLKYVGVEVLPANSDQPYLPAPARRESAKTGSRKVSANCLFSSPKNLL